MTGSAKPNWMAMCRFQILQCTILGLVNTKNSDQMRCAILMVSTNGRPSNNSRSVHTQVIFSNSSYPSDDVFKIQRCEVWTLSNKSFTLFSLFYCCKWVISYHRFACCCCGWGEEIGIFDDTYYYNMYRYITWTTTTAKKCALVCKCGVELRFLGGRGFKKNGIIW